MKTTIKNVALFAVAPFIGLIYAMSMPFVGLGMMGYLAFKGAKQSAPAANSLRDALA